MSADSNPPNAPHNRRSSISQAALSNLFQRQTPPSAAYPSASAQDAHRRRLSVTTIGLSGTSTSPSAPTPFGLRRGSLSTNSDSIDENAVEDDDAGSARTAPTTPFVRRMSFGAGAAMRGYRAGSSPGNGNQASASPSLSRTQKSFASGRRASAARPIPPQASNVNHPRTSSDSFPPRPDQQGFNWSEQLRSRAESSVSGARPSFPLATSPPKGSSHHDRAKSVSDMPPPPAQAAAVKPKPESRKPDAFQERILKGDFYMD
ncbi:hypothetical protein CDD80_4469 [Ophiocordyceps camponoti-rufipedis]|uniref:Uncharacterized protein n=1 Tax=Ophiocordyceps camponoti-rufipedis TaxID=2004952 RepID=A0A2C5Z057_9HYPO|nr:hypothetical protein CDD80_4469 [Ophiocordyceps camponoti-rufipedis]